MPVPYDTNRLKEIADRHIAGVQQMLHPIVADGMLRTGGWSNERGLIAAYVSLYPSQDRAQDSIDAMISLAPKDGHIKLTADISRSNGDVLADVDEREIPMHDEAQVATDVDEACRNASLMLASALREILPSL